MLKTRLTHFWRIRKMILTSKMWEKHYGKVIVKEKMTLK